MIGFWLGQVWVDRVPKPTKFLIELTKKILVFFLIYIGSNPKLVEFYFDSYTCPCFKTMVRSGGWLQHY